jgi:hypothetical protein
MIEMDFKHAFVNTDEHREWLTCLLHDGVVAVHFTKKDGTEREMACTLDETIIPQEHMPKGVERTKPTESLSVFDVEKNEWRSFRWDSVKVVMIGV